ncbi:hypothetical protein ABZ069_35475 [Streptomyces microflavus]|uniref:hypothetical protein n=1 Tax=Streptomyces microflavus TaxID=1919 RepID=UPI0033B506EA
MDGCERDELREFARELDGRVRTGQGLDGRPEQDFVVGYLRTQVSRLAKTLGRMPTRAELIRELVKDDILNKIHPATFVMLLQADPAIRLAPDVPLSGPRRSAERRLTLALYFLPQAEREHYRQEWGAEMADMSPSVAACFALNVLIGAPGSGLVLRLSKIFGRQAA